MSEKKFHVGQTVVLHEPYQRGGTREVTITRVGRTLVYIQRYGREQAFYAEDGSERRGINAPGLGGMIRTLEEEAEAAHRAHIVDKLRELGIGPARYSFEQSTDALDAILAIAEADWREQ